MTTSNCLAVRAGRREDLATIVADGRAVDAPLELLALARKVGFKDAQLLVATT